MLREEHGEHTAGRKACFRCLPVRALKPQRKTTHSPLEVIDRKQSGNQRRSKLAEGDDGEPDTKHG